MIEIMDKIEVFFGFLKNAKKNKREVTLVTTKEVTLIFGQMVLKVMV
jgi:hypothetical protein